MGMNRDELHVQGWNFNIMTKDYKTWVQFANKLKNSNENCFILADTTFETEHEREFEKMWDRPIYFNSFSSNQGEWWFC